MRGGELRGEVPAVPRAGLTWGPAANDACRKVPTGADSLSLVRFDDNDYSVPVRHAHRRVVAKGYVDRVESCRHEQVLARHGRCWGPGEVVLDPVHYLAQDLTALGPDLGSGLPRERLCVASSSPGPGGNTSSQG
jgi:hypothetical protein